jgi:ATPase
MITKYEIIIPDTSVLVQGILSEMMKSGKIKDKKILIPRAAVDELQAQASRGRDIGFQGLEEIKKIRELGATVEFTGERPTLEEIQLAKKGRIDAIIRDVAAKSKGILFTCDYVQALVGEAEGVPIEYIRKKEMVEPVSIEKFFTPTTQSVHLKAGVVPMAKIGKPGSVELKKIGTKPVTEEELENIISQIVLRARREDDTVIEMGMNGAIVVQMGKYRISIARPPFASGLELTAVRPTVKLSLKDYNLHEEVQAMLVSGSRGILIAGPPGSGKSTFAASIANFLASQGKIVKTFEQPRDLQVDKEITQYGPLEGDWEKTADILLLVRPDYTIFDEIRRSKDFRVFGDMRLAGVGMIGVVHATDPVSAIQRFIGRIELGMIPHVVDTVIYINSGKIEKTFTVNLTVKVPTGMQEADLTRPVVEIKDFETKELEYEIYTYGEENVIVPIKDAQRAVKKESPVRKYAQERLTQLLSKHDPSVSVEFTSDDRVVAHMKNDSIARFIGKQGSNIDRIEKELGLHISVEPRESTLKGGVPWDYEESGAFIILHINKGLTGKQVDVYHGEEFLFSPYVGKNGMVKVKKKSDLGRRVMQGVTRGDLKVMV